MEVLPKTGMMCDGGGDRKRVSRNGRVKEVDVSHARHGGSRAARAIERDDTVGTVEASVGREIGLGREARFFLGSPFRRLTSRETTRGRHAPRPSSAAPPQRA